MVADSFSPKLNARLRRRWWRTARVVVFLFGLVLVLPLFAQDVARDKPLLVFAEDFPPFCYRVDGQVVGFGTELVSELLTRAEVPHRIRIETWKRAYHQTKTEAGHALYSVTRSEKREADFRWVGPLFEDDTVVYQLADGATPRIDLDRLREAGSIGVLAGGFTEAYLKAQGFRNLETHRDSLTIYRKLLLGRLDFGVGSDWELLFRAKLDNLDSDALQGVFTLNHNHMYLAFHRDTPPALIQRLQSQLDALKKDGFYQRLLKKYRENPPIPAGRD